MDPANLPSRARWFCESGCGLRNIGNGAGWYEPSRCGGLFYWADLFQLAVPRQVSKRLNRRCVMANSFLPAGSVGALSDGARLPMGVDPLLIKAYREARYVVDHLTDPLVLSVGRACVGLRSLMSGYGVSTAALLTAFNPGSVLCSDEANVSAQASLVEWLKREGYVMLDARGEDTRGVWPSEESVLVLGIPQYVAEQAADRFGQNAFVWVGTVDGFVSLKLRKGLLTLSEQEITQWIDSLPIVHRAAAACLSPVELSWLMSVNEWELLHWLYPQQWDLNEPWPLAKPDGSAMGVGTELDRMFRIVAAGQVAMF